MLALMAKRDHTQLFVQAAGDILFNFPDAVIGHLFLVILFCQLLQLVIRDVNRGKLLLLNDQLSLIPKSARCTAAR